MNVLVVAAHPDDEVLGCGGTMARLSNQGDGVVVAILGEGATSRYADRQDIDPAELEALRRCAAKAGQILGVRAVAVHDFPDNRFDTIPFLDVVKHVEGLVDLYTPELVLTHFGGDLNIDHRIAFQAVLTACRPGSTHPVREILTFEVPSSTEWSQGHLDGTFSPTVFYDIIETLDRKIEAMACYGGESRPFPHPRSPEGLIALARWRGVQAGRRAAEAFETVRLIR